MSEQLCLIEPNGSPAFTPRCAVCGADADRPHWPHVPWPCCGECYFVHCVTCRGGGLVHSVAAEKPRKGAPGPHGGTVLVVWEREDGGGWVVTERCQARAPGLCLGFECHPEAEVR